MLGSQPAEVPRHGGAWVCSRGVPDLHRCCPSVRMICCRVEGHSTLRGMELEARCMSLSAEGSLRGQCTVSSWLWCRPPASQWAVSATRRSGQGQVCGLLHPQRLGGAVPGTHSRTESPAGGYHLMTHMTCSGPERVLEALVSSSS